MSSSAALYTRILPVLRQYQPTLRITQLITWAWLIVGLIQTRSVHLSELATALPGRAQAAGRVARFRRWLDNRWIDVQACYDPFIRTVLAPWRNREVTIILDGCFVNRQALQFTRLSLSHCYRAVPLTWTVTDSAGVLKAESGSILLDRAADLLSHTRRITFLADSGFRHTEWARMCHARGWDYIIRIANNTRITYASGAHIAVNELIVDRKKPMYLSNVRLTADCDWCCHLIVTWTRATKTTPSELCAVMTNLPPTKWVLNHYLKRMHIEESFRDDKSGSFDLGATKLRDPQRLDRLLLATAMAVLWIYELGEQVLRGNARRTIDPAHKRQLSVFQLGWRTLQRAICCGPGIPAWTLTLHPFKPEPAWRGGSG